jgi:hypothetical protein
MLLSDFKSNVTWIYSVGGVLDLNNHNIDCYWLAPIKAINNYTTYCRNGIITVKAYGEATVFAPSGIFFAGSSTIFINSPSDRAVRPKFFGKDKVFNKIIFAGGGPAYLLADSFAVSELVVDTYSNIEITYNKSIDVDKFTVISSSTKSRNIRSNISGTKAIINISGIEPSTVEYCTFQDIRVTEARKLIAKNSIDLGNNQNIFFDGMMPLVHELGQIDKMYYGDKEINTAYYGEIKIL